MKRIADNTETISESDVVPGSIVILDNSASGSDNPTGHTGIIEQVVRDKDGNITTLKMIDSGGTEGPRESTLISNGTNQYWGNRITGFRKFDTKPDVPASSNSTASSTRTSRAAMQTPRSNNNSGNSLFMGIKREFNNFMQRLEKESQRFRQYGSGDLNNR